MEEIIQEKISADHLLYVSLKYTKTCDVIINLLLRWRNLIDVCINKLLLNAKNNKKLPEVSENVIGRIKQMRKVFRKEKDIVEVMDFFMMLRKLEGLEIERIGEFRKNVALKIQFRGKEVNVNLEQLKIYAEMMEKFSSKVKEILTK
ncbi:MAG: hypothetical protein U9Q99_02440 [Nanoarchaeota archaeon]|nr:hypothetical protein [Nanoarchaeota archaeon]